MQGARGLRSTAEREDESEVVMVVSRVETCWAVDGDMPVSVLECSYGCTISNESESWRALNE